MSVGDVLDGAFGGLRATFVPVALVVLVLLGPLQLALNLALTRVAPGVVGGEAFSSLVEVDDALGAGDIGAFLGVGFLFGMLSYVVSLVVGGATVALLLQHDRGEDTDARAATGTALSVLGATLGATVLFAIAGTIAFVGFVATAFALGAAVPVVGPIVAVLAFLPGSVLLGLAVLGTINLVVPIAVVERGGPIATAQRALWVLRRRFWRLIGVTALIGLLVVLVAVGFQLPFLLLAGLFGPFGWIVESVGEVGAQVVSVPVTAFAALLVYLDARVRSEGLDLQLRARDLGAP